MGLKSTTRFPSRTPQAQQETSQFAPRPFAVRKGTVQRIKSEEMDTLCETEDIPENKFMEFLEQKHKISRLALFWKPTTVVDRWPLERVSEEIPAFRNWLTELYTEQRDAQLFATVQQGQFVISHVNDNITGLSTTGAAPCLVVSIRSNEAGIFGLAHMDSVADVEATVTGMLRVGHMRAQSGEYTGDFGEFCGTVDVTFGGAQVTGLPDEDGFDGPGLLARAKAAFTELNVGSIADDVVQGNDFSQGRNLDGGLRQISPKKTKYADPLERLADYAAPESLTYNLLSNIMYSAIFSFDQVTREDEEPVPKKDLIALAVRIASTTTHEETTAEDDGGEQMERIPKREKIDILLSSMETMVEGDYIYPTELAHILLGWR